jgi:hypothetical protein
LIPVFVGKAGNKGTREPENKGIREPGNQRAREPGKNGIRERGNEEEGEEYLGFPPLRQKQSRSFDYAMLRSG